MVAYLVPCGVTWSLLPSSSRNFRNDASTIAPTRANMAKFTWAEGYIAGPLQSASTTCVALSDQFLETTCAFEVGDAFRRNTTSRSLRCGNNTSGGATASGDGRSHSRHRSKSGADDQLMAKATRFAEILIGRCRKSSNGNSARKRNCNFNDRSNGIGAVTLLDVTCITASIQLPHMVGNS